MPWGQIFGPCATVLVVTDPATARPLRFVIGEGVRRVREAHGVRQEEVSRAARAYGLAWARSRIAALERGDKAVSADELTLLPLIMSAACTRPVALSELVAPDVWVRVGDRAMPGSDIAAIWAGGMPLRGRNVPGTLQDLISEQADAEAARPDFDRLVALGAFGEHDGEELRGLWATGASLAEERAATRLSERPRVVAYLARAVWGASLDEERDRIVAERDPDASPDRRRALRGQVNRELVEVLAAEIARREKPATESAAPTT